MILHMALAITVQLIRRMKYMEDTNNDVYTQVLRIPMTRVLQILPRLSWNEIGNHGRTVYPMTSITRHQKLQIASTFQ